MRLNLTLEQSDLEQAITGYVKEKGFPIEGMYMNFDFINGRKGNGTRVEIELTTEKPQEGNGELVESEEFVEPAFIGSTTESSELAGEPLFS
jgi:hypothetical protein